MSKVENVFLLVVQIKFPEQEFVHVPQGIMRTQSFMNAIPAQILMKVALSVSIAPQIIWAIVQLAVVLVTLQILLLG